MDLEKQVNEMQNQLNKLKPGQENQVSMVVFSGDLDKLLASLIIATGSAAMGMKVVLFYTFWATASLRDKKKTVKGKDFMSKMFGFMLPKGSSQAKLSKMNMAGAGTAMLKGLMKKKNVQSVEQLLDLAAQLDVQINICEMSMDLMGFKREEMIDYPNLKYCGVATFLAEAQKSKVQLFV
ncbi:MAG: DsrE/DsrF/DrsH-like family protein [Pseudomonadota bacterium]